MFDLKIVGTIVLDFILAIAGILFWLSDSFAHALGVIGFSKRFFAGIVCFGILLILSIIAAKLS